jgi:hypothetical protein
VHNKSRGPRRIVSTRSAGLVNAHAPFWKGQRAETIVSARHATIAAEKEAKRLARAAKKRTPRDASGKRIRTPNAQLRRLERALDRRKTLAGRQSVQQQIKALKREHPAL